LNIRFISLFIRLSVTSQCSIETAKWVELGFGTAYPTLCYEGIIFKNIMVALLHRATITRAKDVLPNKPHAGRRNHPRQRRNGPVYCYMTLFAAITFHSVAARGWLEVTTFLSPMTLTFDLVRARDQTRLAYEFGANPFCISRDIWFTNRQSHRAL